MKKISKCFEIADSCSEATTAYPSAPVLCCTSAWDINAVVEAFDIVKGKPVMRPSAIARESRRGGVVILDGVGFLGDGVRYAINKIVNAANAGRKSITVAGKRVRIAEGFKIVGVS